jgi:RNA polymerase sigma-70 factor (ECF subfamily)
MPTETDEPTSERAHVTSTSRSLLVRARSDERAAWDRLVGLYAPLVLGWCRRWGLEGDDAADVFQEVFQSVAANLGSFRKESPQDSFRAWLRTVTRNKAFDHYRRAKHEPQAVGGTEAQMHLAAVPDLPLEEDAGTSRGEVEGLFRRALEQIRGQFEPRTWQAFWRMTVDEQPAGVVAAELAMSPGAVRVAKSRVLRRLREELGDLLG